MEQNFDADDQGAELGDPRRCPRHGTVISSPDGQFDGPCPQCEGADDEYDDVSGYEQADELPDGTEVDDLS